MQFEADPAAAAWLAGLVGGEDDFDWDAGNRTKNKKHGVERQDIEAMLHHGFLFHGRVVEPAHNEPRWLALGQDARGRRLVLVFTRRGDRVRPISCRPMRREERRIYEEEVRKQQEGGDTQ